MNSTVKQIVYAILAILGIAVTWYFNLQYFAIEDTSLSSFIADNKLNPASTSVWYDVCIAYLAGIFFIYHESKRLKMPYWWMYAILSTCIAFAFGLPLYLLMRERHLSQANFN